jgi:hypothetical protein
VPKTIVLEVADQMSAYALALDLGLQSVELADEYSTPLLRVETDDPEKTLRVISEWLDYSGVPFADVQIDGESRLVVASSLA